MQAAESVSSAVSEFNVSDQITLNQNPLWGWEHKRSSVTGAGWSLADISFHIISRFKTWFLTKGPSPRLLKQICEDPKWFEIISSALYFLKWHITRFAELENCLFLYTANHKLILHNRILTSVPAYLQTCLDELPVISLRLLHHARFVTNCSSPHTLEPWQSLVSLSYGKVLWLTSFSHKR